MQRRLCNMMTSIHLYSLYIYIRVTNMQMEVIIGYRIG